MANGHDRHDLALVVAYADGEVEPAEERAVEMQVAACSDCTALVDDLRALALADRALATPPRPRDFRLTSADAVRLAAVTSEPVVPAARLVSAMTPAEIATHATHDPELIAATASGGATDAELVRAESWLSTCAACGELRDDLVAIAVANRTLLTPARTRDFVLSEADARSLRSGGWRGLLARIGTSRDAFSRPLAVGLTTLGLAGLVLASGPSLLTMSASGPEMILSTVGAAIEPGAAELAPDESTVFNGEGESPEMASAAPALPQGLASAAPSAAAAPVEITGEYGTDGDTGGAAAGGATGAAASDAAMQRQAGKSAEALAATSDDLGLGTASSPSPLVILSLVMLAVGVGLFILRWSRRRQRT